MLNGQMNGRMSMKPNISGSNYLMKMSDYGKGDWHLVWDALFCRFMHIHREFFIRNPSLGMLVRSFDGMESGRKNMLIRKAEDYLASLEYKIS